MTSRERNQSKYCYEGSDILINHFNERDKQVLDQLETIFTMDRLLELQSDPPKGIVDFNYLKTIHYYVFQNVYPFAGKTRTENIAKGMFSFAPVNFIESYAKQIFQELKRENDLAGLNQHDFCNRAAYYMAEINVLHPFREGNGRVNREFIRTLALRNGYRINWSLYGQNRMVPAMIKSKTDYTDLALLLEKNIEKV